MVKVLVLLKRCEGQRPVDLVEGAEERPHKLHPADLAKQVGNPLIGR